MRSWVLLIVCLGLRVRAQNSRGGTRDELSRGEVPRASHAVAPHGAGVGCDGEGCERPFSPRGRASGGGGARRRGWSATTTTAEEEAPTPPRRDRHLSTGDDDGVRFGGSYSDPKHPSCERSITIISDSAAEVYGADAAGSSTSVCDGKTDVAWGPLLATLETIDDTPYIMVDMAAKGGPSNLIGMWDGATPGIAWADGNSWTYLDGGVGDVPTSTMRTESGGVAKAHSTSTATTNDDVEAERILSDGVRTETIVMLLFSVTIVASVVYVMYRQWNARRYRYQVIEVAYAHSHVRAPVPAPAAGNKFTPIPRPRPPTPRPRK